MRITTKIIKFLLISFLISILSVNVLANSPFKEVYLSNKTLSQYSNIEMPQTTSGSILLINPESGLVIYEKDADKIVYPTSTVKIMTAIIAYENIEDLSVPITVTRKVVNESTGAKLGLQIGDVYSAEELLKAVMICGSNDAANQLAEYVSGGDKAAFLKMMNDKALELGCTNTNFTNVTGIHDDKMYTTARDIMKIALYAYNIEMLSDFSNLASYSFAPQNDPDNYRLKYNRNYFISRSASYEYYYKNAYGLNSGGTPQAGNCLVTSVLKNEVRYVCVIMDSPTFKNDEKNYAYLDAKKLFDTCFSSLEYKEVLSSDSIIYEVPIKLCADTDHIPLYPKNNISFLLPKNLATYEDITYEKIIHNESYNAPISSGDVFGELIVRYKGDYILGKTQLVCKESYSRSTILYVIDKIQSFITSSFFIVSLISALILFGIYAYFSFKNRNRFFSS